MEGKCPHCLCERTKENGTFSFSGNVYDFMCHRCGHRSVIDILVGRRAREEVRDARHSIKIDQR